MKTYQERLLALATEFARAEWRRVMANERFAWDGDYLMDTDKKQRIDNMLPQAAIALKHMAEEWKLGYLYANSDDLTERAGGFKIATNEHLTSLGLIEPQTT